MIRELAKEGDTVTLLGVAEKSSGIELLGEEGMVRGSLLRGVATRRLLSAKSHPL